LNDWNTGNIISMFEFLFMLLLEEDHDRLDFIFLSYLKECKV